MPERAQPHHHKGLPWSRAQVVIAALLLLSLSALLSYGYHSNKASSRPPLPELYTLGGDFVLPSTRGGLFDSRHQRGKVLLLTFGFTSCPDVCPTVLSRMRDVLNAFPAQRNDLRGVFVSLDPERDSLPGLKQYLAYFGQNFIGLSGSLPQTTEVAALFKVAFERIPGTGEAYSIAHSDHIFLIDRHGRVRATFGNSSTLQKMQGDVESLLVEG